MLLLCTVLLFGNVAYAEETPTIEFQVKNQIGKKGDIVEVPINLTGGNEIGGFQMTIYYDSEEMEFADLKKDELLGNGGLCDYNHDEQKHSITVVYVTSDTIKAEGTALKATFKLKKDCEKELSLGTIVTEVVDATDESNPVKSQVSGVSKAFQAKIEEHKEEIETETQEQMKEDSDSRLDGRLDTIEESSGSIKKEQTENTAKNDAKKNNSMVYIVGILILTLAVVIIVWIVKKRKAYKKK